MKNYLDKLIVRRERSLVCESDGPLGRKITHSGDIAKIAIPLIGPEAVEVFVIFALTARHKVTGYHEVARGSLSSCAVSPGDVARVALIAGTPAFIVAHNHPSGEPEPSPEDIALTRKIKQAFDLLGLTLLDHVIVTSEHHKSLLDMGLLDVSVKPA